MAEGSKVVQSQWGRDAVSREELEVLKSLNTVSEDTKKSLENTGSVISIKTKKDFEEIKKTLEEIRDLSDDYTEDITSLTKQLRENLEYLDKGNTIYKETKSIASQLVSQSAKLETYNLEGISLSDQMYRTEKSRLNTNQTRLESLRQELGISEGLANKEEIRQAAEKKAAELASLVVAKRHALSKEERARLTEQIAIKEDELNLEKSKLTILDDINKARALEVALEKEKSLSEQVETESRKTERTAFLRKTGFKALGLPDLAEKEQRAVDASKISRKSAFTKAVADGASEEDAWKIARAEGEKTYKDLKPKWDDLGKSLKNAAISWLLANIIKQFNQVDELSAKLKQNIGTWEHSAAAANLQFASAKDYLEAALHIAEKFYLNTAVIFTPEEMGKIAEAKNLLGLSADEASNLAMYSKAAGISAENYKDGIEAGFKSYVGTNKVAVNHGQVLRETLRTSDAIRLSVGGTGKGLAEAAAAALSIGMNLEQVQKIAQSLINFESSIESEMTAQLLTGQQMNLAKARELALNNDLEGVVKEISNQGVDMVKFGSWNYIQQENFAKALGMSREELAKMLVMQGIQKGLSEDQIAANMKISKEEIHAMSTAQEWKVATDKLVQSITPLVKILATIIDFVSMIISKVSGFVGWVASLFGFSEKAANSISKFTNSLILGLTLALPLIGKVATGVKGIITAYSVGFTKIKGAWLGLVALIKGKPLVPTTGPVFSGGRWRDAATGKFVKAPTASSMSTTATAGGAQATGTMSKSVSGLGKNMGNLLKGAAAAAILAGAVFILAKACQEFAKIEGLAGALVGAVVGMFSLAGAVMVLGKATGEVMEGAVAASILAGATWVLAKACQEFAKVGEVGKTILLAVVSVGLLVGAVYLLGKIMGTGDGAVAILLGAAAMVILAGATWLLGKALQEIQSVEWETIGKLPVAILSLLGAGLLAIPAGLALLAGASLLALAGLALVGAGITLGIAAGLFALVGDPIANTLEQLSSIDYSKFLSGAGALALFGLALIPFGLGLLAATIPLWLFPTKEFGKIIGHIAKLKGLELNGLGSMFSNLASGITTLGKAVDKLDTGKLAALTALSAISKFAGLKIGGEAEVEAKPTISSVAPVAVGQIEEAETRVTAAQASSRASQKAETQQVAIDLSKVEGMLTQLLGAVREGKNIYLNGDKVGQTLAYSTTKM